VRDFVNRSAERWALIRRTDQLNTRLAVFVHGFRGDYLTTWGMLPTLLEAHADATKPFDGWDYYFLGFPTRKIDSYLDIADLIGTVWNAARSPNGFLGYGNVYTELALVAHSLGTLGVRQLLCTWDVNRYGPTQALRSVTLIGSPLNGSPWASLAGWFGYDIAAALKANNPQLRMLRSWWGCAPHRKVGQGARLLLGTDDQVVGYQSKELMQWDDDQAADVVVQNHSSLVKPAQWQGSFLVSYLQHGL
jgi:hypothetical protein